MTIGIHLVCCTMVILNEIKQGVRRKDIALTYAMALRSWAAKADNPDWKVINEAIRAKWGVRGLKIVKNRAWALAEGRIEP